MPNNIIFNGTEKFGRLVPIESLGTNDCRNRKMWRFKCDCGNETMASASDVILGRKQSCGCLWKEHKQNCGKRLAVVNLKPNKEGPINKLYGSYKRAALRRGYEWNLSKKEFREIISKQCYYCGIPPESKYTTSSETPIIENILIYNGVDRKNNGVGYSKENCITACGICNRMKMNLGYEQFIYKIKQIHKKLSL